MVVVRLSGSAAPTVRPPRFDGAEVDRRRVARRSGCRSIPRPLPDDALQAHRPGRGARLSDRPGDPAPSVRPRRLRERSRVKPGDLSHLCSADEEPDDEEEGSGVPRPSEGCRPERAARRQRWEAPAPGGRSVGASTTFRRSGHAEPGAAPVSHPGGAKKGGEARVSPHGRRMAASTSTALPRSGR